MGWPVVAGLMGVAAYGSASVLQVDLHNPGATGSSVLLSVPDLQPGGPLASALLLAGLLAAVLPPAARPAGRWVLPVLAVK